MILVYTELPIQHILTYRKLGTLPNMVQGTWESPGGRCVNYIVLKENLENRIDITKAVLWI